MLIAIMAKCFLKLYSEAKLGILSSFGNEDKNGMRAFMVPDNFPASFKRKFPVSFAKEGNKV